MALILLSSDQVGECGILLSLCRVPPPGTLLKHWGSQVSKLFLRVLCGRFLGLFVSYVNYLFAQRHLGGVNSFPCFTFNYGYLFFVR